MSCDITRIFHTLIRALETTADDELPESVNELQSPAKSPEAFSFHQRAISIHSNLSSLAEYIKRVQQLTGTTLGSKLKQKMHSDLMNQVNSLFEHCAALLYQLKEISEIIDASGAKLTNKDQQLSQHRSAVLESLEEELRKLRRLRDMEFTRQRRLMEMSGSLAAGVRSISSVAQSSALLHTPCKTENSGPRSYSSTIPLTQYERRVTEEPDLSETELRVLERENQAMYEHLSEQKDDLDVVARAIQEIGKLNQTLSAHLVEQFETVQQIGDQFSTASENIIQGNTLLRNALSSKASAQFWILFTMIVLTFSLHFLDWYYP